MEKGEDNLDKLIIKLRVLDCRIKKLESITNEIVHDVESEYRLQIKDLYQKKDEAFQKLLQIRKVCDSPEEILNAAAGPGNEVSEKMEGKISK